MTGYKSKRAAAQDKLVVTDIDGHVVRDARKPKKATALDKLDSMERKALKMALEALELLSQQPTDSALDYADNAINALRERLAQPEQEPKSVTYKEVADAMNAMTKGTSGQQIAAEELGKLKLYTTPTQRTWVLQREWVDLTDEEIDKWAHELHGVIYAVMADLK